MTAAALKLTVLGPLRVWRDGVEVGTGPRQCGRLLAALVARPGRPVSTAELVDLLWDGEPPASATNVIHKYVGAVRRLLEPDLPPRETGSYVHRRGTAYVFRPAPGMLDLVTFRDLVDAARKANADENPRDAFDRYVEALALWHGPAGGGLIADAVALDEEFSVACREATALAASGTRPERILPALRLASAMAPLDEPVQAGLISLLTALDRQAEALSVYRTVRARLADELGVDPGPTLRDAHRRSLDRAAPSGRDAGPIGRDGEMALLHRLVEAATLLLDVVTDRLADVDDGARGPLRMTGGSALEAALDRLTSAAGYPF